MKSRDLIGKDVVIWGAGREGLAAQEMLRQLGVVADTVVTGGADHAAAMAALQRAKVIVKSPGIPHTAPEYQALRQSGAVFTSLMDLWLSDYGDRTVAVTGTKGKSTTSSMVNHIFNTVGVHAVIGGNLGVPLTTQLGAAAAVVVAEVSSYQAAEVTASPRFGVFTSLYPEHLPWHGDFTTYVNDKTNLFAHGCAHLVTATAELRDTLREALGAAAANTVVTLPSELGLHASAAGISWDGVGSLAAAELQFLGLHNFHNATLALTVCALHPLLQQVPRAALLTALTSFKPLATRLERVPTSDGRRWIDDGLATAPEAVIAALQSCGGSGKTALLFGGAERNLDFAVLRDYLRETRDAASADLTVIAMGPAGQRFAELVGTDFPRLQVADSFAAAVTAARSLTSAGDTILLSPGAPSFNEFKDYEERSAAFKAEARASSQ